MVTAPLNTANTAPAQGFPQLGTPFVTIANGVVTPPWFNLLLSLWNRTGVSQGGVLVPSGQSVMFVGPANQIPEGWLLCNGTLISQTTYAALFQAIGNNWGTAPAGFFRLPDFQGKVLIGADGSRPYASYGTLGKNGTGSNLPGYAAINYIIKT